MAEQMRQVYVIEIEEELKKANVKLEQAQTSLKKYIEKYKKADIDEKEKWKKEALAYLKKKKLLEKKIETLQQYQIQLIKSDIKRVHEDMVIMY